MTSREFCGLCGKEAAEAGHPDCIVLLALEPPRYCTRCGRRLKVQVTPRGWSADCIEHGPLHG